MATEMCQNRKELFQISSDWIRWPRLERKFKAEQLKSFNNNNNNNIHFNLYSQDKPFDQQHMSYRHICHVGQLYN